MSKSKENNNIQSPVVVFTGAGGDLGSEMVKTLSSRGYRLALIGRTASNLHETLQGLTGKGHIAVQCDLSQSDSIMNAVEKIRETYDRVDVLVNNAAHFDSPKKIEDISNEEIQQSLRSNLEGPFILTREIIKIMKENKSGGKIVNIGSTSAFDPYALRSLYQISKKGMEGFTRSSAAELKNSNISVDYLCPGPTEGKRVNDVIAQRAEKRGVSFQEMEKKFASINLEDKLLSKDQINQALLLLLDRKIGETTGNTLGIDNHGIFSMSHPSFIGKGKKSNENKSRSYVYKRNAGLEKNIGAKLIKLYDKIPYTIRKAGLIAAIVVLGIFAEKMINDKSVYQKDFNELLYEISPNENDKKLACEKYGVSMDIFQNTVGNTYGDYQTFDIVSYEAQRNAINRVYSVDIGGF